MNERNTIHFLGISVGNSFFSYTNLYNSIKTAIAHFSRVIIVIFDLPAISTYVALGYPVNIARKDKVFQKSNSLRNKIIKILNEFNCDPLKIRLLSWKDEVDSNELYHNYYQMMVKKTQKHKLLFQNIYETTQSVLISSKKTIQNLDKATHIAMHYLISELAFFEFTIEYFHIKKSVCLYHRPWPIFQNYVAGILDGEFKDHLGFYLISSD